MHQSIHLYLWNGRLSYGFMIARMLALRCPNTYSFGALLSTLTVSRLASCSELRVFKEVMAKLLVEDE
jgi:hypothetical protein